MLVSITDWPDLREGLLGVARLAPATLVVLCLGACATDATISGVVVVHDSAGVEIVENPGDVWSGPQNWRLSEVPVLRIGAVDGEEAYLFGSIQGIVALSDGRVVVADRGDNTMRWYSSIGDFLFQRGGTGEGPGEFTNLRGITLALGDTIVALDYSANRINTFSDDGGLVDTMLFIGPRLPPSELYRLSDGSYVSVVVTRSVEEFGDDLEPGLLRAPSPVLRIAADGSSADTIGTFPGPEVLLRRVDGRSDTEPTYFARTLRYAAGTDMIYVGTEERFRIDVYSPRGDHIRSIRAPEVDHTLDQDTVRAFRTWMVGRLTELPAEQRRQLTNDFDAQLEAATMPETVPAYSRLMLDPDGNLWVAEYRFELNLHPPDRWVVFDSVGRFVSAVRTPERFELLAASRDRVYGRATDEMNVQYVVAYAIERDPE